MADSRTFTVITDPRIFRLISASMATFYTYKDPAAVLDYYMDWTNWLTGTETLATSTWTTTNTGITLATATGSGSGTATVWVSGGSEGEVYDVTNKIVTSGSRREERTIQFTVLQR